MTDFPDDLPAGWRSFDAPPGANEEFGTQPTWQFAKDDHGIGVVVRPLDTDAPHGDPGFQVMLTRGPPEEAEAVAAVRDFAERDDALAFAREVMETCDELYERNELDAERAEAALR